MNSQTRILNLRTHDTNKTIPVRESIYLINMMNTNTSHKNDFIEINTEQR